MRAYFSKRLLHVRWPTLHPCTLCAAQYVCELVSERAVEAILERSRSRLWLSSLRGESHVPGELYFRCLAKSEIFFPVIFHNFCFIFVPKFFWLCRRNISCHVQRVHLKQHETQSNGIFTVYLKMYVSLSFMTFIFKDCV